MAFSTKSSFMQNNVSMETYESIRAACLKEGRLYVDEAFPTSAKSLKHDGTEVAGVTWRRPKDIFKEPKFILDGITRDDLDQGGLGDCWFIAAAATVACSNKDVFAKVVPADQSFQQGYAGIFRFRFWWYGAWREVHVDDQLPVKEDGRGGHTLMYLGNRTQAELWPALLEKAYAKLRGCCYESLDGGRACDALTDLCGGVSELVGLQDKARVKVEHPNLFRNMLAARSLGSLFCASIFTKGHNRETDLGEGLVDGHVYSITALKELTLADGKTVQLVRVRNPWGNTTEWTGAWSDKSEEMQLLPASMRQEVVIGDGEFWMSHEDFVKNFDEVVLCHLNGDALISELEDNKSLQTWKGQEAHGAWVRGVNAGGPAGNGNGHYWKNPQYHIEVKDPAFIPGKIQTVTHIVSLIEKEQDNSVLSGIGIGFDVFKLTNADYKSLTAASAAGAAKLPGEHKTLFRQVTARLDLTPGHYKLVLHTGKPHEEAGFMIRVFSETPTFLSAFEDAMETNVSKRKPLVAPVDLVMTCFQAACGPDSRLDAHDLATFLALVSQKDIGKKLNFQVEQCRSLMPIRDENKSGRLDLREACDLWMKFRDLYDDFKKFDADGSNSVDVMELGAFFANYGVSLSPGVLATIVRRYADRHHRVSLEDFIVAMLRFLKLFESFARHIPEKSVTGKAEFGTDEFLMETMDL